MYRDMNRNNYIITKGVPIRSEWSIVGSVSIHYKISIFM